MIYQNNFRDSFFASFSVKGGVESSYFSTNSRVTSAYFLATMGAVLVESSSLVVCRLAVFSDMMILFVTCKRRPTNASARYVQYLTNKEQIPSYIFILEALRSYLKISERVSNDSRSRQGSCSDTKSTPSMANIRAIILSAK